MKKFTIDTNCLIALEEERPEAVEVRGLIEAHLKGRADVAVVAISASEEQKDRKFLNDYGVFERHLKKLGVEFLNVIFPMAYFDISFFDKCLWSNDEMIALEKKIHEVLFPNMPFLWEDFCAASGHGIRDMGTPSKWKNCKCDVQMLWSHINDNRDVFVTVDRNFHKVTKKPRLVELGAKEIVTPKKATSYL